MILALSTGRNDVSKAMLRLVTPAGIQFHVDQASLHTDEEDLSFEVVDGSMILLDIPKDTTIRIAVPHTDATAFHAMVRQSSTIEDLGLTVFIRGSILPLTM